MFIKSISTALVIVVAGTVAASANQVRYVFGVDGSDPWAFCVPTDSTPSSNPNAPVCGGTVTESDLLGFGPSGSGQSLGDPGGQIGIPDPSIVNVPTIQVRPGSGDGVGVYDIGIGIDDAQGVGTSNGGIEPGESLILDLSTFGSLVGLELSYFNTDQHTINIDASGGPGGDETASEGITALNAWPNGDLTMVAFGDAATGTEFEISSILGQGATPPGHFFVYSATFDFSDNPAVVPVPPAAPLLAGALGLLYWRARKAKMAA